MKKIFLNILRKKNFLKSKDEFTVVKIKGEYSVKYQADYILISEETVPDLNIEIYIAKNFDIGNNSLPLKTVVLLLQKIIKIVVYILFVIAVSVCFLSFSRYVFIKKANCGVLGIKTFRKG